MDTNYTNTNKHYKHTHINSKKLISTNKQKIKYIKLCEKKPQNKYNSTFFINPKIFVDVDGTLTFNKHG